MSLFDRFADATAHVVASAAFFAGCVLLIVMWAPSLPLFGDADTWQLVINTVTTIVTFLLLALLHNAQNRFERATNQRFEELLRVLGQTDPADDPGQQPSKETP